MLLKAKLFASVKESVPEVIVTFPTKLLLELLNVTALDPAFTVVVPVTAKAPLWVNAPPVVTPNVPETVLAPSTNAPASVRLTLFPEVIPTVLKLLVLVSKVMLLPEPATKVVTPVTAKAPLCVNAPPVVTPNVPETVLAPKTKALVSRRLTLAPVIPTAPVKSLLALFKVTF